MLGATASLHQQGIEPEHGDGKVVITLSEKSGEVLSKVDDIRRWRVEPTMLRGWKQVRGGAPPPGPSSLGSVIASAKPKASTRAKKKVAAEVSDMKTAVEVNANDARRTPAGRSAIMLLVEDLFEADRAAFASAPCFGADGTCRLKFDGASNWRWAELLSAAPDTLECMSLGKRIEATISNNLLYRRDLQNGCGRSNLYKVIAYVVKR